METFVCGGLRIDYVISATGEVRLNQIGGNAIYAAVGARTYTDRVHLLARAGDNYPQEWLDELARQGILSSHLIQVPGWQDMRTFYAYIDEKTRIDRDPALHFARIGQPLPEELEGYVFSTLETQNRDNPLVMRGGDVPEVSADAVHIAPMALRSHLELAQAFRQQQADQITVDPGEYELTAESEPIIKTYCGLIDAFLPSELEMGLLLDTSDPYEAAETFASWGAPLVVIKRGPDGCLLYERDARKFTNIPAYPVQVVDVTGAGDTFGGAFAVALNQTGDPIRSVVMATVAASLCLQGYGALYGLNLPPGEVKKRLDMLMERVQRNR
jgi:sugar/nucleoside kinase (ribokinase family)